MVRTWDGDLGRGPGTGTWDDFISGSHRVDGVEGVNGDVLDGIGYDREKEETRTTRRHGTVVPSGPRHTRRDTKGDSLLPGESERPWHFWTTNIFLLTHREREREVILFDYNSQVPNGIVSVTSHSQAASS